MPDNGVPPARIAGIETAGVDRQTETRRPLILAACLMATFMTAVESTIIATAMPTIVGDLGGFSLFSWVFAIYLLTQAVSIPVYGRLADIHGRKPVFLIGAGLFLCGSTLCGFSQNMLALIGFRALQGFGAGAIQPIAATILGDIYNPTERGKVQGLVSSVFGVSAVIGPSLGAFIIEHLSWPIVFWVNLPIGAAAMIMLSILLRERVERRQHQIDWIGSLLLLIAVGTLMAALVQNASLSILAQLILIFVGLATLAVLILHERSIREPMLPLELWRHRVIVTGSLGSCAAGAVMMGVSAFLPAYVQGAMGRSALAGGIVLGAMSVSWSLASIVGARLMVRTTYRFVAILGALALITGCGLLITLTPERGPAWAGLGSFVIGIGMGFSNTVFIVSIQASVPWRQRGAATSSSMFLRFIGQSLGAASCGAVLNATLSWLDPHARYSADRMLDPTQRVGLSAAETAHLTDLIARSLHNAYFLTGLFSLLTLVIALNLPAGLNPTRHASHD
ncbi:MAG TPA: MDR family MFS transporter [Acetobacteraceae bacterium]|nr:MDR family MFS transporter [Acetobacteraceae bacterium]